MKDRRAVLVHDIEVEQELKTPCMHHVFVTVLMSWDLSETECNLAKTYLRNLAEKGTLVTAASVYVSTILIELREYGCLSSSVCIFIIKLAKIHCNIIVKTPMYTLIGEIWIISCYALTVTIIMFTDKEQSNKESTNLISASHLQSLLANPSLTHCSGMVVMLKKFDLEQQLQQQIYMDHVWRFANAVCTCTLH